MRLLECRDSLRVDAPRTPGVARLAVLGDVVAFGRGVAPTETLPFHLQRRLNAIKPGALVEVLNCAVCGDTIWNTWSSFTAQAATVDAVLAVFAPLMIRLFTRTAPAVQTDPNKSWMPGHPAHAALLAWFDAAVAHCATLGATLAVAYGGEPADADAQAVSVLSAECAARGIPFADLTAVFTAAPPPATPAAPRLTGKVFNQASALVATALAPFVQALPPAGDFCATVLAAVDATAMHRTGPLLGIEWALQVLAAQEQAGADVSGAPALRTQLGLRLGAWNRLARTGAEMDQCDKGPEYLGNRTWKFDEMMLLLDEAAFTAPTGAPLGFPPPVETDRSDPEYLRGLLAPGAMQACKDELASTIATLRRNRDAFVTDLNQAAPGSFPVDDARRQAARLDVRVAEMAGWADRLGRQLDMASSLVGSLAGTRNNAVRLGLVGFALREATGAFREVTAHLLAATAPSAQRDLYNTVEITIDTAKRDEVMQLYVFVDYIWPRRRALRDVASFLLNGQQQTCMFRVPCFHVAELTLEISPFAVVKWFEAQQSDGPRGAVSSLTVSNSAGKTTLPAAGVARREKGRLLFPPVMI